MAKAKKSGAAVRATREKGSTKGPTREEQLALVKSLTELQPKVRPTSAFGDNHHAAMDAQIDVISNLLNDNEIFDKYGTDEEDENGEERAQNVLDAALDARKWLDGVRAGHGLVEDWEELVRR